MTYSGLDLPNAQYFIDYTETELVNLCLEYYIFTVPLELNSSHHYISLVSLSS